MAKRSTGQAIIARLRREFADLMVEPTRGGHTRLMLPGAPIVYMAGTPGDWRELANTRARLRRAIRKI